MLCFSEDDVRVKRYFVPDVIKRLPCKVRRKSDEKEI